MPETNEDYKQKLTVEEQQDRIKQLRLLLQGEKCEIVDSFFKYSIGMYVFCENIDKVLSFIS